MQITHGPSIKKVDFYNFVFTPLTHFTMYTEKVVGLSVKPLVILVQNMNEL